jgi:hypothetical protein
MRWTRSEANQQLLLFELQQNNEAVEKIPSLSASPFVYSVVGVLLCLDRQRVLHLRVSVCGCK